LIRLSLFLVVLFAWYWGSLPGRVSPLLLPPPTSVFRDFWNLLSGGDIWPDVFVTLQEWMTAFLLAAVTGCGLGYVVSRSGYAVKVFEPLFAALYSIPSVLFYPLYLLFFGLGSGSKIALGATIAFFPIILSTIAGLSRVDRSYIRAADSMG